MKALCGVGGELIVEVGAVTDESDEPSSLL